MFINVSNSKDGRPNTYEKAGHEKHTLGGICDYESLCVCTQSGEQCTCARTCHDDLRRNPGPCAGNLQGTEVRRILQLRREPHIRNLGCAIRRYQHIARLQVQVHHPAGQQNIYQQKMLETGSGL